MPPFDQSTYQVRLDWGLEGLARLAPADIVVVVDVLRFSTTVIRTLETEAAFRLDAATTATSINGAAVAAAAAPSGAVVLLGALRNASAVAAAVYADQQRRGGRTSVNILAAGERTGRGAGSTVRFAVEDHLGAGAVIDALAALGLDHSSPEAAVAGEAFHALRRATRHLLTASGSGRELTGRGRGDEVDAAAAVDAASVVPILRAGEFRAV
ncbi:2-phosphosulfolactate phosphatase [Microbacterium sp. zg.B48]|uniref:2-phosphosulfolactate phosphatase n=1 Tax=unclassified Microbacterium TaxID=2609290 RepID=UPI00214BA139|nr:MULTISPECIES: 2-phosphosulfolactate phosphatase [unclassified Microbacterium]MCR2763204.1 2-phosphosulfolactate phosphatase [Microbacterium sp. zg.B48]MCR2808793.1 2-phosphosulfolactate phosphatase [Microbacterium sp. zg.B185]WIM18784.1 2-phosphosulfolactate phosphatase [Microbacterium sp. zg-B185]